MINQFGKRSKGEKHWNFEFNHRPYGQTRTSGFKCIHINIYGVRAELLKAGKDYFTAAFFLRKITLPGQIKNAPVFVLFKKNFFPFFRYFSGDFAASFWLSL
jgi:hypothetical protein